MDRIAAAMLVVVVGCGGVRFVSNEDPRTRTGAADQGQPHAAPNEGELEGDQNAEPERPFTDTVEERAMAHLHTRKRPCSAIVVGKRIVATAHRCFPDDVRGPMTLSGPDLDATWVEVASSRLTWTKRKVTAVVTPNCPWKEWDVAFVVLDEAVPDYVEPIPFAPAPAPGANVLALGFGTCPNEARPFGKRTGNESARRDDAVVVDMTLCRGDTGGAIVSESGVIGVISHHGEVCANTESVVTVFRFDTTGVRTLLANAEGMARGETVNAMSCPHAP